SGTDQSAVASMDAKDKTANCTLAYCRIHLRSCGKIACKFRNGGSVDKMRAFRSVVTIVASLVIALPITAQMFPPPAQAQAPSAAPASGARTFSQEELDQLVAPIALYPDALFTQGLMASTYPIEIVSAERWVKANPGLKDKALEDALQQQTWDASVKSLAVFPQVLTMMSDTIDWTQKLGDAFLAQQQDVMATAQTLRAKAQKEGALKDTKEQKVTRRPRTTRRTSSSSRRI